MACALTLLSGPEFTATQKKYVFGAVLTSTYPANGEVLDFAPYVSGDVAALPISVVAERTAGYAADYVPGASIKLGKLKIFSAPGTEFTAGAYSAALLAATDIRLTVVLPK